MNNNNNRDYINDEIERIANMMMHDGISPDEQDLTKLAKYVTEVQMSPTNLDSHLADVNTNDSEPKENRSQKDKEFALNVVYEALLYRKLRSVSSSENILDRGSKFGAGFS